MLIWRKPHWESSRFGNYFGVSFSRYSLYTSARIYTEICPSSWYIHSCLRFCVWVWSHSLPIFRYLPGHQATGHTQVSPRTLWFKALNISLQPASFRYFDN